MQRLLLLARQLQRSPLFTTGALLCCLGVANTIVGITKFREYDALAAITAAPAPTGVTLSSGFTFSDVSESQERHNIAVAKLQYYSVVLRAGALLLSLGLVLLVAAYLRLRITGGSPSENKTLLDSVPRAT
jgi:hypothetical protein